MRQRERICFSQLTAADTKIGSRLFLLCWLMYTVSYLGRYNFSGVMNEMIKNGGFTAATAGAVATSYFAMYGAGQLVHGMLGQRVSPFRMMLVGIIAGGAANLLMPLCAVWQLAAAVWAFNGFAQAMAWPAIIRIIADIMPPQQRERACIHICSSVTAGTLAAYGLTVICLQRLNWQAAFTVAGVLMFVAAVLWLRLACPIGKRLQMACEPVYVKNSGAKKGSQNLFKPMALSGALVMLLPIAAHGMMRDGISTWIPVYLTDCFSITTSGAILVTMLLPVINLSGAYIADFVNRRLKNEAATAGVFFCVAAVAILGLIFLPAYSALVSALLFSVVTASMCAVNTMLVNLLPVKLGKNGGGTFYAGVTNSSAYFGGAASSLMIAAVLGFGGWREVNFLWCGIGIISAAVCFICAKPWARFFKADIVKKI